MNRVHAKSLALLSCFIGGVPILASPALRAGRASADGEVATTPMLMNEHVAIRSAAPDIALAGTLTMPTGPGPFPAAVLLSVALPNDRDMTHPSGPRLFQTLAEHLANSGIATLRCDDRGIGESTGSYFEATIQDLAADALAGVAFLKQRVAIDPKKVGVIGISEGATVGAIAASRSGELSFVVMLAGIGVPAETIFRQRTLDHAMNSGYPRERVDQQLSAMDSLFAIVKNTSEEDPELPAKQLRRLLQSDPGGLFEEEHTMLPESPDLRLQLLLSPWYRSLFSFDPREILEKVRVPVLAVTGDLDRLSPADQHFPAMLAAFEAGRNPDYTLSRVPGLNHVFQRAKTGSLEEQMTLAEDFSPMGARIVSSWIRNRFR